MWLFLPDGFINAASTSSASACASIGWRRGDSVAVDHVMNIWASPPRRMMLIFLAAIQDVPGPIYEAAISTELARSASSSRFTPSPLCARDLPGSAARTIGCFQLYTRSKESATKTAAPERGHAYGHVPNAGGRDSVT